MAVCARILLLFKMHDLDLKLNNKTLLYSQKTENNKKKENYIEIIYGDYTYLIDISYSSYSYICP